MYDVLRRLSINCSLCVPLLLQRFNLADDIGETINLFEQHPEIAKALLDTYNQWDSEMSDPMSSDGKPKRQKKKNQKRQKANKKK